MDSEGRGGARSLHPGSLSLDAFLARRATDRRLARLTHDLGLPEGRGLEFGPADNPTPLPDGIRVAYVDHAIDAQAGRPDAVPIDHVWSGSGPLGPVLGETGFDFAIAAQVAQYVPNLLGWFRGIYAALRPGGVLNLSLPDRRFMFDAMRTDSTMAELVEADLRAYTRPSPRQLFAHTYEARALEPGQIWAGEDPAQMPRLCGDAALALAHAEAVSALETGRYVNCHCWVFTPSSLLDLIGCATQLGLFPFVLNQLGGTEPGGFEFYVSMRRDTQEEPQALRGLQDGAIAHLSAIQERQRRVAALIAKT
ncbi:class I SAM-dependent methyltransferase [Methylobacterium sp. BTF04]|uniref:methyltransferase domain-containing protein n=1 Tax=Methylobacterium sp. BTF04 TaxID=2708300 RepID=UPI0013D58259|nr:class I SAM-dependent methyltransferase [Methylobacterium sp. BTF04]NEU12668.1 class I SAM-dependent methyltransferase [Methylobacterium sp. BTF04]